MSAGPANPWVRGITVAMPLVLFCAACAQPARVVLYEQRQQMAQRGVRDVQAPVPQAKPSASPGIHREVISTARPSPRSGANTGSGASIEVNSLPPVPPRRPDAATSTDTKAPASRQVAINPAPPPSLDDRRATTRAPAAGSVRPPSLDDRRATTRAPAAGVARPMEQTASAAPAYRRIPPDGIHVVTPKQTVYALSRLYGVPVRSLLVLNDLEPPYLLQTGQKVKIPVQRTHVVSKGETVYAISRQYDVSLTELVRLNEIGKPFTIVTGQTLLLPDEQHTDVATAAPETPVPEASGDSNESDDEEAVAAVAPPKPKRVVLPPSTNIPKPKELSRSGFLWPVSGKLISRFGGKGKGLRNDGINIEAPRGTPIRAAQNGVVAYRGNQLRGFGNLLLIKHDKGYMTAYAHADRILVERGARVKRGQVIARVGSTGSVATSQLHFEIRRGRTPIDPLRHLRRRRAEVIEVDAEERG